MSGTSNNLKNSMFSKNVREGIGTIYKSTANETNNTSQTNHERLSYLANNLTANGKLTLTYIDGDIISNLVVIEQGRNSITVQYDVVNQAFITFSLTIKSLDMVFSKTIEYKGQTTYKITGLTPDTPYNISLTATTFYDKSTTLTLQTTTLNPPDPPSNLRYSDKSNTYITIEYDAPIQTINTYSIYVSLGGVLVKKIDISGGITSYQITGLVQNLTYAIGVKAINNYGISDFSNIIYVKTTQIPGPPQNIVLTPGIDSGIYYFDLSYSPPSESVEYYIIKIERPDISGGSQTIYQTTNTSYRLSGLITNTQYKITLTVHNSDGNSIPTIITKYTLASISSAIFPEITKNSLNLSVVGNFASVNVYNSANVFLFNSDFSVARTISGLTANTPYFYYLVPVNPDNISGSVFTTATKYTLASGSISYVYTSNETGTTLQINWRGTYTRISISRNLDGTFTPSIPLANYPNSSTPNSEVNGYVTDTGLNYNTQYFYSIELFNGDNIPLSLTNNLSGLTKSAILNARFYSVQTNQITISDISGYYQKYQIQRIPETGLTVSFDINDNTITSYTDTGLNPNKKYTYNILPYALNVNSFYVPGVLYTGLGNIYTLPQINSAQYLSPIGGNVLIGNIDGVYSNLSIYRYKNTVLDASYNSLGNITSFNDHIGLIPNNEYNYKLLPLNFSGVSGELFAMGNIYSGANGNPILCKPISETSIELTWNGYYSSSQITRIIPGGNSTILSIFGSNYPTSQSPQSQVVGNIADTGLLPNTAYTYSIKLYNKNSYSNTLANITSNTLPSLISARYSVQTIPRNISIQNITGYYTKFKYTRTGGIEGVFTSNFLTGNSFVDSTILSKNTQYTYIITPYNYDDLSGNTISVGGGGEDGTIYTLPEITGANVTNIGTNSIGIQINPSSSYYYGAVSRTDGGSNFTIYSSDSSGTDTTGLSPNTGYNYIIVPYNVNGTSYGSFTFSSPIYTLGQITGVQLSATSVGILGTSVVGNYKFFKYIRTGGTEGTFTSDAIYDTIFTDITSLTPNTQYTYSLIPYNYNDLSATPFISSIYTLPNVNPGYNSSTANTIRFELYGNYQYVTVNKTNLSGINTTENIFSSNFTYIDTRSIQADTSYNYTFIPYNNENIQGNTISLGPIYSLPAITNASVSTITNTSISISNIIGKFKYVIITRTDGNGVSANITLNYPTNSITDTNLLPNSAYTYTINPYGQNDASGNVFNLGIIYTKPLIYTASYTDISSDQISLDISGLYNTLNILRNDGEVYTISSPIHVFTNTNLLPNNNYSYLLTPYNPSNNSGDSFQLSDVNTKSQGNVTSVVGTSVSSVKISWSGYYNTISIVRNSGLGNIDITSDLRNYPNSVAPSQNISGYIIDQNLLPGTSYFYTVKMFNADGYEYLVGNSIAYITLPTIYSASFGNLTASSIEIRNILGSYTYITGNAVPLFSGETVDFSFNSTEYVITGLMENKSYSINLVPYNNPTSFGYTYLMGSTYTLPTLRSASYGNITATSIEIISLDGSYNTVYGYRNGSTSSSLSITYPNTLGTDSTDLSPNSEYYYSLTPYNGNATPMSGNSFTLGNIYTLATGSSVTSSDETSSSLLINWSGIYYSAIIEGVGRTANLDIGNSQNYSTSSQPSSSVYGNIRDIGLEPNTLYIYDISLNNYTGNAIGLSRQSRYTLCEITSGNISTITSSSIYVQDISAINGYSAINILSYDNDNTLISSSSQITDSNYNLTGLNPNSYYSLSVLPYNGNLVSGHITPGNAFTIGNTYTLCEIAGAMVGTYTNSQIQITDINATNGYNSVNVFAIGEDGNIAGNTLISSPINASIINGLSGNTPYTVKLLPYNILDISGHQTVGNKFELNGNVVTLCNITSATYGNSANFSSSTISIDPILSDGGYNNVKLYRYESDGINLITILDKGSSGNISDTGLSPNTQYIYGLLPQNSAGIYGHQEIGNVYRIEGNTCTLCEISSASIDDIQSRSISVNSIIAVNGYSAMNFYRGNGSNISLSLISSQNTSSANYTDQGLSPNSLYNYWIMPYNINSVGGHIIYNNKYFVNSQYTLSELLQISATALYPYGISIYNVTGINGYTNVLVYRADLNGTQIGNILSSSDTIMDMSASLPNHQYTYNFMPYNFAGLAGNASLNQLATKSIYTVASGNSLTPTDISSNALLVNWEGTYGNVLIARSAGGGTFTFGNSSAYYLPGDITPSNFMTGNALDVGLNTNTLYTYDISLVNMEGIETPLLHQSRYTLANGSFAGFSDISANALRINWQGIYSSANVLRNGITSISTDFGNNYPNSTSSQSNVLGNAIDSGLDPNTLYNYNISFINGNGTAISIPEVSRYTLTSGNSSPAVALGSSSIQTNWNGIYSNILIYRNGEDFSGNIVDQSNIISSSPQTNVIGYCIDSGLIPNSEYNYTFVMQNGNNVGSNLEAQSQYTLASISAADFGNSTSSSIQIGNISAINGYLTIDIYRNSGFIGNIGSGVSNYTDSSGLSPNSQYSYYIIPYNQANIAGHNTVGGNFSVGNKYTLSQLSGYSIDSTSGNIILSGINGAYANVNLYSSGNLLTAFTSSGDSYVDILANSISNPNTQFTYNLLPYNGEGVAGNVVSGANLTISKYTLSKLSGYNFNAGSGNVIISNVSGGYANVSLYYSGNLLSTFTASGDSYVDILANSISNPNTEFTYNLLPYNAENIAGNVIGGANTFVSGYTLSKLTDYTISGTSGNIVISGINGGYANVNLYKSGNATVLTAFTASGDSYTDITANSISNPNTQFTYNLLPYNLGGVAGNVIGGANLTVSSYTLSKITGYTFNAGTGNVVISGVNGSYGNVKVYRSGNVTVLSTFTGNGNSYTDTIANSISNPNTLYTYNLLPYNSAGIAGNVIGGANLMASGYTLSKLTGYSINSGSGNIVISGITGAYGNVNLYRSGNATVVTAITASGESYTDILANSISNPNYQFTYNLLPFNSGGVAGNIVSGANLTISTYTLSKLTGYSFNAGSGNVIISGVTGVYANVNLYKSGNGTVLASFTGSGNSYADITANSISNPNTLYTYNLLPYNSTGVAGNVIGGANLSASGYTLSKLTGYSINSGSGNIVISGITGAYGNVNLYRSGNATVLTAITASGESYTDILANSVSNPNYQFSYNLLPFNSGGVAGNIVSGANLTISTYTLSKLTGYSFNAGSGNVIISGVTGVYANVNLYKNGNGTVLTSFTGSGNSYADITANSISNPNTLYTYNLLPYNTPGIAGNIINGANLVVTGYTLSKLTGYSISSTTGNVILSGITGSYANVNIYRSGNGTVLRAITASGDSYTDILANSISSPNTVFTYNLSPYNSGGVAGNVTAGANVVASIYTLASGTLNAIDGQTSSSLRLNWSGSAYNTISIARVVGGGTFTAGAGNNYPNGSGSTIINGNVYDTGLSTNVLYAYDVSLNNGNSVGKYIGRVGAYTLASGTQTAPDNLTSSSMQINWSGIYTNVYAYQNGSSTALTGTGNNYNSPSSTTSSVVGNLYVTGLSPNTMYYYDISMVNGNGVGTGITRMGAYTMCQITGGSYGQSGNTTITVQNVTAINNYNYVQINGRGGYDPSGSGYKAQFYYPDTGVTVTGLTPNSESFFDLRPYNGNGVFGHLTLSGGYALGKWGTTPSPPIIGTITANSTSLNISFSPASGGSLTLTYNYWVFNGVTQVSNGSTSASPIIVTGLTNGTTYTIYLNSQNTYGTSGNSTATAVAQVQGYNIISTTGLTLYYPFDSSTVSGSNLANMSTGTAIYDASMVNNPSILASSTGNVKVGSNSIYFNKSLSQTAQINKTVNFTTGGTTFTFWIYPVTITTYDRIFSFSDSGNFNDMTDLDFTSGLALRYGSVNKGNLPITFTAGVWTFFCITMTYSTGGSSTWNVYKNGNSTPFTSATNANYPTSTNKTFNYLARAQDNSAIGNIILDDFRMYNRVITTSEMSTLYNFTGL